MTINISGISKLSSFGLLLLFALIFVKPQSWCSVRICFEAILFLYTFNVNLYIYIYLSFFIIIIQAPKQKHTASKLFKIKVLLIA